MSAQQIEGAAQTGQHAEPQHVDLQQAERLQIVLVPFDHGAVFHGRILDRNDLVERRAGDDEAADMLRQVTREALQFPGQRQRHLQPRIGRDRARCGAPPSADTPSIDQPHSVEASAETVSSESPKALPTSRTALRPR